MIMSNGRGTGVLASDALLENGGVLATPSPKTLPAPRRRAAALLRAAAIRSTCSRMPAPGRVRPRGRTRRHQPQHRWPAGHPLPPADDRPHPDPPIGSGGSPFRRANHPGELDGRGQLLAGEDLLNRAGIGTFRYPDSASAPSATCGDIARTSERSTRPPPCRRRTTSDAPARPRSRRRDRPRGGNPAGPR